MAVDHLSCDHADDDYIDMEVGSYSAFVCNSMTMSSPPHPREFEFQMASKPLEKEPSTSPADELFYKGKLLPLHLPPRLQMVEKLLQNSNSVYDKRKDMFEEFYSTPLMTNTAPTPTTTSTPFESCNISPSESCQVSRELNPEEYILEYSTEVSGFMYENPKKSWTRKFKHSSLGSKLKASQAYLKSLFGKSGCSDESSAAAAAKNADESMVFKSEDLSKYAKKVKKNPFGHIQKDKYRMSASAARSFSKDKIIEDGAGLHRRSFSVALKRNSTKISTSSSSSSGSSSSSCSNHSNGTQELQFLKRCSSASSEIESSIQGAIAHCKQSLQTFRSRKTVSEVGFYSLSSASRVAACEDQERPDLCRGCR